MAAPRVCIRYKPRLYSEILTGLFQSLEPVEVVENYYLDPDHTPRKNEWERVDVIILPLNKDGLPELELLLYPVTNAKIIAFSPAGDTGFRRLPGENHWEMFQPFGLYELMKEVVS
jgi:hypothetical protein